MTVTLTAPSTYTLAISPAERELLIAACELAIATKRREPEAVALLPAVNARALDALTDRLVLIGIPEP